MEFANSKAPTPPKKKIIIKKEGDGKNMLSVYPRSITLLLLFFFLLNYPPLEHSHPILQNLNRTTPLFLF